jgi:flagellar motor switch protein FliG
MAATPVLSTSRQRAAAFVLAIGTNKAEEILQHLRPSEVEALAEEISRLASFDQSARVEAMRAAVNHLKSMDPTAEAAMLRRKARQMATQTGVAPFDPEEPFAFLESVEIDEAVQFLRNEHPQTVAVILANQNPGFASKILKLLDERMAGDIALRIATIGRTNPDLMERIVAAMRSRLTPGHIRESAAPDGAKELAAILNNADKQVEEQVLGALEDFDTGLAEKVRALMFVFEDMVDLDDKAIQQILQNVETATLALSLKGALDTVKDKVLRNLSERAREALTEEIDLLGQVRRSDVNEAQAAIVAQIRALEAAGQIVISRGEDNDYVE